MGEQRADEPDADEAERYLVVDGRRWRRQDPMLPDDVAAELKSHLGRARSGIGRARREGSDPTPLRARVQLAKVGLGERGTPWWEQSAAERRQRWTEALSQLAEDESD